MVVPGRSYPAWRVRTPLATDTHAVYDAHVQRMPSRAVPALVVGAVLMLFAAPIASADLVEVASVNGTILDASETRVLYRTADDQSVRLRDTAPNPDTDVAVPLTGSSVAGNDGRLIPGGALVSATASGDLEPTLFEWRSADDSLTGLGIVNPPRTIHVAGNYAIWSQSNQLWFRNVALDTAPELVSNAAESDADVAANGVVVFSKPGSDGGNPYDVFRWQSPGPATQLSVSGFAKRARYPLTDGSNTVWAGGGPPPNSVQASVVFNNGTAGNETAVDQSLGGSNGISSIVYRINAGWVAYPRAQQREVWTRRPVGTYAQVPTPTPAQAVFIRAVNPDGQVVYERRDGDGTQTCDGTETLFVGTPGAPDAFPVESKPFDSAHCHFGWSAFWSAADEHWYVVRPNALLRLETDTAIVGGPPAATSDSVANFRFASTAANPHYTCEVDGNPVICANTYTTASDLADGVHTLTVESKDLVTNEQDTTAGTLTWTIDHTAPAAFAVTSPADGGATNDSTPAFTWQAANDSGSGITGYDVFVDGQLAAHTATTTYTPGNPLDDGQHTWHVVAGNGAGVTRDSGPASFAVDTGTPPSAPALGDPAPGATSSGGRPTLTWSPSTDAGGNLAGYDVELDGSFTRVGPTATSFTPSSDLGDGQHAWRVVAIDSADNRTASGIRHFTVDARPPTAHVSATPNPALAGESVHFSGAASSPGGAAISTYEWDLDGDGSYERNTGADPTVATTYGAPLDVTVGLRITDAAGRSGTEEVALSITPAPLPGTPGISINDGDRFTNNRHVTLTARWPKYATSMLVSNDGGFDGAEPRELRAHPKWKLASSGRERLPTTVYVRFAGGLAGNETYQDDIVLDLTDPVLVSASAERAAERHFKVRVRARDGISGVRSVQLARSKRHPGRAHRFARTVSVTAAKAPLFARVIDGAGNLSGWERLARG